MTNLPRFTLSKDQVQGDWKLTNSKGTVVHRWDTKEEATAGGQLESAINGEASVRIEKERGGFDEERTFPRSSDPRQSPG
jgi:hypothetical protein